MQTCLVVPIPRLVLFVICILYKLYSFSIWKAIDHLLHIFFNLQPGSKLKAIDPLLHMVLDQCGQEILGGQSSIKLKTPFIPSSKMNLQPVIPPQQVIFATAYEHEFYTKLTSSKTESRYLFESLHM
jgi:hypothetical protein